MSATTSIDHLERLQKQFFASDDQLLTLRMYQIGLVRENVEVARRLGLWISSEGIQAQAFARACFKLVNVFGDCRAALMGA
jgi:hypothetical protein